MRSIKLNIRNIIRSVGKHEYRSLATGSILVLMLGILVLIPLIQHMTVIQQNASGILEQLSSTYTIQLDTDMVNEQSRTLTFPSKTNDESFLGREDNENLSYFGLRFSGFMPKGVSITNAQIVFTTSENRRSGVNVSYGAVNALLPQTFSTSNLPSQLFNNLTPMIGNYNTLVPEKANTPFSIDVTKQLQEVYEQNPQTLHTVFMLLFRAEGKGNRVYIFNTQKVDPTAKAPYLVIHYSLPTVTPISTSTPFPSVTTPSPTTGSTYPFFRGVYLFTANPAAYDLNKYPNLKYTAGAVQNYYWSELEPQRGQYNWSLLDGNMAPWVGAGKKVIIRISNYGWQKWYPPVSGHGTPQWVYDEGVQNITEVDGSVMPQSWNPIFLSELYTFLKAFAARYDGNPHIAYIEIGLGIGGEARVDSHDNQNPNQLPLWQTIGYTDALWWQTIQHIVADYQSSFHSTPLAVMPDKVFIGGDSNYNGCMLLDLAVRQNYPRCPQVPLNGPKLWLQDNGLWKDRHIRLYKQFYDVSHPEEQSRQTSLSGDTLEQDLQESLAIGGNYALIFGSDVNNPANTSVMRWAASITNP